MKVLTAYGKLNNENINLHNFGLKQQKLEQMQQHGIAVIINTNNNLLLIL